MSSHNTRNTKTEILDTASRLFFHHGYHVGVDRIIAEAGVAKMTFYKHFPAKSQLISIVIERVHHRIAWKMREIAAHATGEALEQAVAVLSFLSQSMTDVAYLGALIPQALVEIHEDENESRQIAIYCTKRIIDSIERACLKADISCAVIARQLHAVITGGHLLRQVLGAQFAMQATEASVLALLHLARARSPADKLSAALSAAN